MQKPYKLFLLSYLLIILCPLFAMKHRKSATLHQIYDKLVASEIILKTTDVHHDNSLVNQNLMTCVQLLEKELDEAHSIDAQHRHIKHTKKIGKIVRALASEGFSLNSITPSGEPLLFHVAQYATKGYAKLLDVFLNNGASPDFSNNANSLNTLELYAQCYDSSLYVSSYTIMKKLFKKSTIYQPYDIDPVIITIQEKLAHTET
jgi:hypothetical protein